MIVGDKVKVIEPDDTSRNELGLVGYITEKEFHEKRAIYRVCRKKNCIHREDHSFASSEYAKQGWYEYETGIELFNKEK